MIYVNNLTYPPERRITSLNLPWTGKLYGGFLTLTLTLTLGRVSSGGFLTLTLTLGRVSSGGFLTLTQGRVSSGGFLTLTLTLGRVSSGGFLTLTLTLTLGTGKLWRLPNPNP